MLPATDPQTGVARGEPTSLRSRKKERTRLAIEDAALDLFAERGYEETTVEEIVARAEVSKATFFRYFAAKRDVIFGSPDDRHRALQDAIVDRPAAEDAMTAIRVAIREQWLPLIDPRRTIRQTQAARSSPLLRGLSLDLGLRWQADVSEALARRRGLRVPDRECRLTSGVVFAVLSNAVNQWVDANGADDLAALIDQGFDLLARLCSTGDTR